MFRKPTIHCRILPAKRRLPVTQLRSPVMVLQTGYRTRIPFQVPPIVASALANACGVPQPPEAFGAVRVVGVIPLPPLRTCLSDPQICATLRRHIQEESSLENEKAARVRTICPRGRGLSGGRPPGRWRRRGQAGGRYPGAGLVPPVTAGSGIADTILLGAMRRKSPWNLRSIRGFEGWIFPRQGSGAVPLQ
jgi:hypothetical protein